MREITEKQQWDANGVGCFVCFPVIVATLGYLTLYVALNRLKIVLYARFFIALVLMLCLYSLSIQFLFKSLKGHLWRLRDVPHMFNFLLDMYSFQLRILPTLLYTWQFFDLVISLHREPIWLYYTRQAATILLILMVFVCFLLQCHYETMMAKYEYIEFRPQLINEYSEKSIVAEKWVSTFLILACLLSVFYILGTF